MFPQEKIISEAGSLAHEQLKPTFSNGNLPPKQTKKQHKEQSYCSCNQDTEQVFSAKR